MTTMPSAPEPPAPGPATSSAYGWYGDRPLRVDEVFPAVVARKAAVADLSTEDGQRTPAPSDTPLVRLAPTDFISRALSAGHDKRAGPRLPGPPSLTFVTSLIEDRETFRRRSEAMAALTAGVTRSLNLDWVVYLDGLRLDANALDADHALPTRLFDISRPAPLAGRAASSPRARWVVPLTADNEACAATCEALCHYVALFPDCCCIVSSRETDDGLRPGDMVGGVSRLFELPWDPDAVVALRGELWDELSDGDVPHPHFDLYGLVLRSALRGPVLIVPDLFVRKAPPAAGALVRPSGAMDAPASRRRFIRDLAERLRPGTPPPARRGHVATGLCIIGTRGDNMDRLREAVGSVLAQSLRLTACVVVHGPLCIYDLVVSWLKLPPDAGATPPRPREAGTLPAEEAARSMGAASRLGARLVVLHAWRDGRGRGYPLNVGLAHACDHRDLYDGVCFLEEGDILYPMFAERLATALDLMHADVVHALSNRRVPWMPAVAGPAPWPTAMLLSGDVIAPNSYMVRCSVLDPARTRFREDMNHFGGWDFLVTLLRACVRISHLPEVLSERRTPQSVRLPDEDAAPDDEERARVLASASVAARGLGRAGLLSDLARFDPAWHAPVSSADREMAELAWAMAGRDGVG